MRTTPISRRNLFLQSRFAAHVRWVLLRILDLALVATVYAVAIFVPGAIVEGVFP